MPLFMDLHKASDYAVKPTVEEIKRNHIADLKVQHKYGVKFLQYWVNEEAGLVFCLMEGPDKQSCIAVHQEAHGNMPCHVIELQGGDYIAFMEGEGHVNEFDMVERRGGSLDTGYRVILVADFISIKEDNRSRKSMDHLMQNAGGHLVNRPENRDMIVFTSTRPAIKCAIHIIRKVQNQPARTSEVRIGISAGLPVTAGLTIFEDTIRLANRLCDIAQNGQVVISPMARELSRGTSLEDYSEEIPLKILYPEDEQFLHRLIDTITPLCYEPAFQIEDICKQIGMSKSRLYRMIKHLTGYSAHLFIQELRLQKAFKLIQGKYGNVSQVAFEVGFSNPSYFARIFHRRFGTVPFRVLKHNP